MSHTLQILENTEEVLWLMRPKLHCPPAFLLWWQMQHNFLKSTNSIPMHQQFGPSPNKTLTLSTLPNRRLCCLSLWSLNLQQQFGSYDVFSWSSTSIWDVLYKCLKLNYSLLSGRDLTVCSHHPFHSWVIEHLPWDPISTSSKEAWLQPIDWSIPRF